MCEMLEYVFFLKNNVVCHFLQDLAHAQADEFYVRVFDIVSSSFLLPLHISGDTSLWTHHCIDCLGG